MRRTWLSALVAVGLTGCLSATTPPPGGSTGKGGTTGSGGGTGGTTTGAGGSTGAGGTGETGGQGGTTTGVGGGGGSTGNPDGGGADTAGTGGMGGMGGTGGRGGAGGMAGDTGNVGFPMPLRLDDPCSSLLGGNVCLHQGKTSDNGTPYAAMKVATFGGNSGTMYQVKVHVRGVVEPTHLQGGTAGTPAQFLTGGSAYPNNTNEGQYQQWRLTTTVPNQHYYLNNFNAVGLSHVAYMLDYTETITIGGGTPVTLDVNDGNAHEISNTVVNPPLKPAGLDQGSMNSGQFVQIDIESATPM
jgi:hypothetical protein